MIIEKKQTEIMNEFSQWIRDNNWRLNYTIALWENSEDFNLYSLEDVYQIFLKSKEEKKMTPVEWLQVVFKENCENYEVFEEFFNKAKEYEFDILDEFWKFLIDKAFVFNIENKCWESGCQNHKFSTLRELYKFFLWQRNEYI
jgi:hypothetical protein